MSPHRRLERRGDFGGGGDHGKAGGFERVALVAEHDGADGQVFYPPKNRRNQS